jgi:Zn-dependent M28 family amino/carboxypeptidase
MIDQVNSSTAVDYVDKLSGNQAVIIGGAPYTIATRYSRTVEPIQKATQYGYEQFQSFGLTVTYFNYNLPGSGTRRNVIAEQPGKTIPSCIYLIGAHLDSTTESPEQYNYAPGADDNASGSTAVLIAADILSQYSFDCTLRYALWTGEEQGFYGSAAYAAQVAAANEDLRGVLNLDMIGYDEHGGPVLYVHTRPNSSADLALADTFTGVISAYQIDLAPQIHKDGEGESDHASFWDEGYPAIMAIEDESDSDFNPYYHSEEDTIEHINPTYLTDFVRAAVGAMAHLANPHPIVVGTPQQYLPLAVR